MLQLLNFVWDLVTFFIYWGYVSIRDLVLLFVPAEPKSLRNEIVLVTGGGSGIGREICYRLARDEKTITIISWDVNEKGNKETVEELKKSGIKAYAFTVDITDEKQVAAAARNIREDIGDVTMLFNNAGLPGEVKPVWEQTPAVVKKVYDVNIVSHYWTVKEFLPKMMEKKRGHIIETCSVLGFFYGSHGSPYVGTKFAVRGFTESVKEDVRRHLPGKNEIHFSLVYPQYVITNMTSGVDFKPKYPFLNPEMSPKFVASKIVEGVRTNEEHIYVPSTLRFVRIFLSMCSPDVARRLFDTVGKATPVPK